MIRLSFYDKPSFVTQDFDTRKFIGQMEVSKELLRDAKMREVSSYVRDRLAYEMEIEVWSRPIGRIVFERPATWWDHWKATNLPKLGKFGILMLARHPVRFHYEVKSCRALFPEATEKIPEKLGNRATFIVEQAPVTNSMYKTGDL